MKKSRSQNREGTALIVFVLHFGVQWNILQFLCSSNLLNVNL